MGNNVVDFHQGNQKIDETIPFGNGIAILNNMPAYLIYREVSEHNFKARSFSTITTIAGDQMSQAMRQNGSGMAALMFTMNNTRAIPELLSRIDGVTPSCSSDGVDYWLLTNGKIDVLCSQDRAGCVGFSLLENSPRTRKIPFEMHPQHIREFQKQMLQHVMTEHANHPIESMNRWLKMPGVGNEADLVKKDPGRIDRFFANPKSDEFALPLTKPQGLTR